jgi:hypothetical protein
MLDVRLEGTSMHTLSPLAAALLLAPLYVHAEQIDLVCTNSEGLSVNFDIDTSRNDVLVNAKTRARSVSIDDGAISFLVDLSGHTWYHTINRAAGSMLVQSPDNTLLSPFSCERRKPKF